MSTPIDPRLQAVNRRIKGDTGVGLFPCEHQNYADVIDELKKIGSLHHETIRWDEIEKKSLYLLKNRIKDISILTALVLSVLNHKDSQSVFLANSMLYGFINKWGDNAYPLLNTARGKRQWSNRLNQVGKKLKSLIDDCYFSDVDKTYRPHGLKLQELLRSDERIEASDLTSSLKRLSEKLEQSIVEPLGQQSPPIAQTAIFPRNNIATPSEVSTLTAKEIRTHCDSLIKHQSLTDPDNPLLYSLRRYKLWNGIGSLPDHDDDGRTELVAPPTDLRADYQQLLAQPVQVQDWQRLEQSLENSLYWISGHHLSYQYAQQLGHNLIAQTIHQSVQRFIARMPGIQTLYFSDKGAAIPFMDEATQAWLQTPDNQIDIAQPSKPDPAKATDSIGNTASVWQMDNPMPKKLLQQGIQALEANDCQQALTLIETFLKQTQEPRAKCYAQLAQAEVFEKMGWDSMAAEQYHLIWKILYNDKPWIDQWEPQLLEHLNNRLLSLGITDPELLLMPTRQKNRLPS